MTHPRRRILGRFVRPVAALAIATALAGCMVYPFQPEYTGDRGDSHVGDRNGNGGYPADRGEARSEWNGDSAR